VLPSLYLAFGKSKRERKAAESEEALATA